MDPMAQQDIIDGHAHLISSAMSPGRPSVDPLASVEESGPPSPVAGLPANFAEVMPGIYRSSFPTAGNFEHLQSLGLNSVLTLVNAKYPLGYVNFMRENGIRHFQLPIPPHKEASVVIPPETIAEVLKILLDPSQHPILIHCNKGKHRTGCMVACYRKVHGWTLGAILTEYRFYAGRKSRDLDEKFIGLFDQEAALLRVEAMKTSESAPSWLPTPPPSIKNE